MQDQQFRALLNLMSISDPLPEDKFHLDGLLLNESKKRGYDNAMQAYRHFLQGKGIVKAPPAKERKPRRVRGIDKK